MRDHCDVLRRNNWRVCCRGAIGLRTMVQIIRCEKPTRHYAGSLRIVIFPEFAGNPKLR
jgi:hypothetical protein